ncbi:site-specific integrase [Desulfovibrio sulfodismutans]|uniref:Site-specific integrase n=1 Tax=Desulfolutivibrio sulfodismutans TaxID=63561 RepID=A0A7K3NGK2_9BACT|nr:site-specific integrase [Desulfolutivibrio sulfodismutans]NDY55207.1 site-specific integrase [Desulfolutivibrio sulfodismutans]QLA12172.1 tyrosine-type recombinase/integrase [Desulfolutivibrio sulfodismutans DSM 3696]
MATKYTRAHPAKWSGVYCYESTERRFEDKADVCYVIAYKVEDKKRWEKVGWRSEGYTPQVAAEVRAERVKAARHGQDVKTAKEIARERDKRDKTIDELAKAYFAAKGDSLKGVVTDRNRYDKHIRPILGGFRASKLSPLDMARLRKAMTGRAPATVWNALELVRRIVNFGARAKLCPALSFVIEMPRKDNEVVEYLEPEEAVRLKEVLDAWPSRDAARMLELAMFTGMRRGEVFKLRDVDLDFLSGIITIRSPKGGKTVSIPMNPIARAILLEQLDWKAKSSFESPFVFPGKGGGQRVACGAAGRIKKAAGIPSRFRIFHGLRHHFAVTLANSGEFTLDMIGELLTHKSTAMTRRYGQFLPDAKKRASDKAAELLVSHAGLDAMSGRGRKVVRIGGGD